MVNLNLAVYLTYHWCSGIRHSRFDRLQQYFDFSLRTKPKRDQKPALKKLLHTAAAEWLHRKRARE
ncbi:hypothetical protein TSAR_010209 [Trichomalopsis sarcophagae]|uniref:Uncharacterized protein n=1 Tax=Trichomalopsis sarcophagae TaxID=543379 RepID=A0A232FMG3_9HYME|nr:hypothetical protein TSAR_010209 [Trichomalopsis sarcophagae]